MLVLRNFHRLPPLLRVVSVVAVLPLLLAVTVLVLLLVASWPPFSPMPSDTPHRLVLALDLTALSLACNIVVNTYRVRFVHPEWEPFPLHSWQSQVRALGLLAALPTCALVVGLVLPPAPLAFALAAGFTTSAFVVLGLANVERISQGASSRPMRAPRTP